jgi:hypothetical protein
MYKETPSVIEYDNVYSYILFGSTLNVLRTSLEQDPVGSLAAAGRRHWLGTHSVYAIQVRSHEPACVQAIYTFKRTVHIILLESP